jgi:hypothetical protein
MKAVLTFLLVGVIAVVVGLLLTTPQQSTACPNINGAMVAGTWSVGDYITITGGGNCWQCDDFGVITCNNERLLSCYAVNISTSCGGTSTTGCIRGNNLSGNYQISAASGACVTLCACP